jgi:hypothetical protein
MMDMTLTAYRDTIDYLAYYRETIGSMIDWPGSQDNLSKRVMGENSGKVKSVRISCLGDEAGDPLRWFLAVDVPRAHPFFMLHGDDPLGIPENFEEAWVTYRYNGFKDTSRQEAQNPMGRMLMRAVSNHYLDRADWGGIPGVVSTTYHRQSSFCEPGQERSRGSEGQSCVRAG